MLLAYEYQRLLNSTRRYRLKLLYLSLSIALYYIIFIPLTPFAVLATIYPSIIETAQHPEMNIQ